MNPIMRNSSDCEVQSVIRFLNVQKVRPVDIYRQLKQAHGDTVMNERNVRKWREKFNNRRTNVHDVDRPREQIRRMLK